MIDRLRKALRNLSESYEALEYLSFTKQGGSGDAVKVDGGLKRGIEVKMLSAFRLKGAIDKEFRRVVRNIEDTTFEIDCFLNDLDEDWRNKESAGLDK